ncbi:MAG: glycosyltransferase [Flavobacteriaceae bacterium TMED238]|nr:MAG: glycosyltransferase [Flavobacteriaceae bacterium TMED238]
MKKKIAFIKYCGATAGGTEKYLQTIAANLDKSKFEVDFYFSGPAKLIGTKYTHQEPNPKRIDYLKKNGVNLIEFSVEKIDYSNKEKVVWINTNFWKVFNEDKYDLIQIARSGRNEYPYNKIKKVPIIDSIHIPWGAEDSENVVNVLIQSNDLKNKWIKYGGNKEKIVTNCTPIDEKKILNKNLRTQLELENYFIFGLHQRKDDHIFSDVPLISYSKIESSRTAFLIMGGSSKYSEQAKKLKIKNFFQIEFDFQDNSEEVFLNTLDVFTHGRKDGETFGLAIAEAMRNSLPIVSHKNVYNNAHIETISSGGKVVGSQRMYTFELIKLMYLKKYYNHRMKNSRNIYLNNFESKKKIKEIEDIYLKAAR